MKRNRHNHFFYSFLSQQSGSLSGDILGVLSCLFTSAKVWKQKTSCNNLRSDNVNFKDFFKIATLHTFPECAVLYILNSAGNALEFEKTLLETSYSHQILKKLTSSLISEIADLTVFLTEP